MSSENEEYELQERRNLDRYAGYKSENKYVIYDTRNAKKWIKSSVSYDLEEMA
ncbi:MAG: hypothetical protein SV377_04700 [Halobacteria archaeon]|nr:hypothetical protein [Halobacteria archaeon]